MKRNRSSIVASAGKQLIVILFCLSALSFSSFAQTNSGGNKAKASEDYGNTLNIGLGAGYYGYLQGHSAPFIFANYEFDISRGFTLAPFLGLSSSKGSDVHRSGSYFNYHESVLPVGVKGTYYFDELLGLNKKWDVYAALSLGLVYDVVDWSESSGSGTTSTSTSGRFDAELHIGGEYHFNNRLGLFLDFSTGVSTLGVAVHCQ